MVPDTPSPSNDFNKPFDSNSKRRPRGKKSKFLIIFSLLGPSIFKKTNNEPQTLPHSPKKKNYVIDKIFYYFFSETGTCVGEDNATNETPLGFSAAWLTHGSVRGNTWGLLILKFIKIVKSHGKFPSDKKKDP